MTDIVLVIVVVVRSAISGSDPATDADWGSMVSDGQQFLDVATGRWRRPRASRSSPPGSVSRLLGDGLADILRPA